MDLANLVLALMSPVPLRRAAAVFSLTLCAAGIEVFACELEDPASTASQRGALAIAYPRSLQVSTAVWQAQMAGALPRDPVSQREDLGPEARAMLRRMRAHMVLSRLATRLDAGASWSAAPALAVVLVGTMMWNRFESRGDQVMPLLHAEGPATDDVVVVTDLPVIEALASGSLGVNEAIQNGVLRLYGTPAGVTRAQAWLAARL